MRAKAALELRLKVEPSQEVLEEIHLSLKEM
jgi:hypothetical protein